MPRSKRWSPRIARGVRCPPRSLLPQARLRVRTSKPAREKTSTLRNRPPFPGCRPSPCWSSVCGQPELRFACAGEMEARECGWYPIIPATISAVRNCASSSPRTARVRPLPKRMRLRDGRVILFPAVMGVLNVTPDSFSDGGRYFDPARAIEHGLAMEAHGAGIIDIGGESTRPGGSAHRRRRRRTPPRDAGGRGAGGEAPRSDLDRHAQVRRRGARDRGGRRDNQRYQRVRVRPRDGVGRGAGGRRRSC